MGSSLNRDELTGQSQSRALDKSHRKGVAGRKQLGNKERGHLRDGGGGWGGRTEKCCRGHRGPDKLAAGGFTWKGWIYPPEDSWKCLETFLVVALGMEALLCPLDRGQRCFLKSYNELNCSPRQPTTKNYAAPKRQQCRDWETLLYSQQSSGSDLWF